MSKISKLEYLAKQHFKPTVMKMFCFLGKLMGQFTNKKVQKEYISRILVFQGGGIGDVIRMFPILTCLHKELPDAAISILSPFDHRLLNLYPHPDIISEAIIIDVAQKHKTVSDKISFSRFLRSKSFDLIICPQSGLGLIEFSIMAFLMGAPYRIGYDYKGAGFLFTTKIALQENVSIYKQNINLLEAAGFASCNYEEYLAIPDKDLEFAHSFLKSAGVKKDDLIFAISPYVMADTGNKSPQHDQPLSESRNWPEQNYVDLIIQLVDTYKAKVLILSDRLPDGSLSNFLEETTNPYIINTVGRTTLGQAAALINLSSITISNDSGLLHIALGLHRPAIGIYGSTSPSQQAPDNARSFIPVWKGMQCSPCYTQQPIPDFKCFNNIECLKNITVSELMDAIKTLLAK